MAEGQLGVEACPPSKVPVHHRHHNHPQAAQREPPPNELRAGEAQAPPTAILQMPSRPTSDRVTERLSTRSSSGVHGLFLHRESLRLTRTTQLGGGGHRARLSPHFTVCKAVVGRGGRL